eukprot:1594584-Amphidinium_carterae.1
MKLFWRGLEVIARAPWKSHIGANYLAGGAPGGNLINRPEKVPEEIVALASAFVLSWLEGAQAMNESNSRVRKHLQNKALLIFIRVCVEDVVQNQAILINTQGNFEF